MSLQSDNPQQQPVSSPAVRDRPADGTLLVIAGRCGRLGNRIVLFANFIAFAEEHGHRLMNPTFHSYGSQFETTRRDIYCRYPVAAQRSLLDVIPGVAGAIRWTRLFTHGVRMAGQLNERLPIFGRRTITYREAHGEYISLESPEVQARIRDAGCVFLFGWTFRAPACMERHAEKIRAYFRPIEKHDRASREVVDRLRRNADVVIAVHIRQTDYRGWEHGKFFFPISQFATWMHEMVEQFPGSKMAFLVCSDEPRHEGEFPGLSVGFGTGFPLEDICAMARCDYIIGPVSSFSQWASFYGNKPLFHFRNTTTPIERGKFRVSCLEEVPQ